MLVKWVHVVPSVGAVVGHISPGLLPCALLPSPCGALSDRLSLEVRSSLVSGVWSFRTTVPSSAEHRGGLQHSRVRCFLGSRCWHLSGLLAGPTDMLRIGAECHMVTKAEPYLGGGFGVDASGVKTIAWDVKKKTVLWGQASQMTNTAWWVSFQNNPQLGVFAEAMLPTGGGQQPEPSPG